MKQAKKQQAQQQQPVAFQDADTAITGMDEDYDMEPVFNEIDRLEQQGINAADIGKLKSAGLCTVLSVLMW